ncbi:MAG TPA: hypothetical protein VFA93_03070 [Patescibacteria group bacterium]|nr:hypothetical protein [Patescibacteria group bacterium]
MQTKTPRKILDHQTAKRKLYNENLFLLEISQKLDETGIRMKLFTNHLNTTSLPHTHSMLKTVLPSVLGSKCFNEKNLSFTEEVKATEIGHLFEHILLEYLTKLKKFYQGKSVSFSGTTSWDWTKDKHGVFNIVVSAGTKDAKIFEEALSLATQLLNRIIRAHVEKTN